MNTRIVAFLALLFSPSFVMASDTESAIRSVLTQQVADWNRGDVAAFVTSYSDDCLFVGQQIVRGRAKLLERYRKTYPNGDAMGKLSFGELMVRDVDDQTAVVIGKWRLERGVSGGGPVGGVFSLVFQKLGGRWQIIVDHTS